MRAAQPARRRTERARWPRSGRAGQDPSGTGLARGVGHGRRPLACRLRRRSASASIAVSRTSAVRVVVVALSRWSV